MAAALAFSSHQGHQVFHNPCADVAAYCRSRGVVSLVVSVDRLPDHILSLGLELLDGLFAPSPTDSGTAFMAAYLASPPLATLQLASGDRSVASDLGFNCGIGSVMGGVGVHVPSSAPPMGGPGVAGGTSAPVVGLPGHWPDPADGVTAPGYLHPDPGVPTSLGDVGVHRGVSGVDMGGLGVHFARGPSQSGMGGTGVPGGGHPCCMGGILVVSRNRTKGSHPPLAPIMPRVFLAPWLLLAPFVALPSPPWWRFLPLIHPGMVPPSHPRFLFWVILGIIQLRVLLLAAIRGGVPLHPLLAHVAALMDVRLRRFTPFLPRFVIRVLRALSVMNAIGRNRRRMTFCCLRSHFLRTSLLCPPSSRVRIISSHGISSFSGSSPLVFPRPVMIPFWFNWPSTPQFGQPSKFAPAGRAPCTQ